MLNFYIPAALIALAAAALVVRPLIMGRSSAADRDTTDVQVFKDQLEEVERDLARGTIGEAEAEGARVEISRRLIAATHRAERSGALQPAPRGPSGMAAGMLLIGIPALGALIYVAVGVPGAMDQPFAAREAPVQNQLADRQRPSQEQAEARITPDMRPEVEQDPEYVALVDRLQSTLAERPDDAEGQRLLAIALMRLGQWVDARKAFDRLVEISEAEVDAETHANMAEAMVLAAGGYVSPEAEQAIGKALKADPELPIARYYAGLALRQSGRIDEAIRIWEDLRSESPADAPYLEWLNRLLADTVAMRDGPRGPSQGDIAAADDLSEADRAEMIQGMVQRLSDRLATQGGTAREWAQLIASHATLGQTEQAQKALADALQAYPEGGDHDALIAHAARLGLVDGGDAGSARVPGPTAEDVAAAQQMSAEDRAEMIQGMVQRLEDRLTSEGGEAEEWLRLINAYVQLDRKEDATRIYRLAEVALENDLAAGFVKEQALLLGVITE